MEGYGRNNRGEYIHFLGIANGSLMELQTQLELAPRLRLAAAEIIIPVQRQAETVARMLAALRKALARPSTPNPLHP